MERLLETHKTQSLRDSGVIKHSEIVKIVGDLCFAEDVITGVRRMLPGISESSVNTTTRRILRD